MKNGQNHHNKNIAAHRVARLKTEYHEAEQSRNTLTHLNTRRDADYWINEQNAAKSSKKSFMSNREAVCPEYISAVQDGQSNPCHCCGRLWHKKSIKFTYA